MLKKKAHEVIGPIAEKWQALSKDEREKYTEDKIAELRDIREMRELGTHNVQLSAFHDTRMTLELLDEEVNFYFTAIFLIANTLVRSDVFTPAQVLK